MIPGKEQKNDDMDQFSFSKCFIKLLINNACAVRAQGETRTRTDYSSKGF